MARNDDSKRDAGAPSRVFKSTDVHKRRVDRKGREKKQAALSPESEETRSQTGAVDEPSKEAVVITPQFGGRSQAQRESDDRWFAAMRDANAPAEALSGMPRKPDETAPIQPAQAQNDQGALPREQAAETKRPEEALQPKPEAEAPSAGPEARSAEEGEPKPASEEAEPGKKPKSVSEKRPTKRQPPKPSSGKPSVEDSSSKSRASSGAPMSIKHRIILGVVIVIVIALAVGALLFTWNRWYRYDDHADLQGQWYVVGTTVPVAIDEKSIRLTDDVTYEYEIDTQSKTLKYTFGQMQGQGRYWFSDDRQYLVITDGDEYTSANTAFDDLLKAFGDFANSLYGIEPRLPEGEGIIAFSREPDAEALAREKEEAEAKAAAEEAARKEKERLEAEQAAAEAAEWEEYYYEEDYVEQPPAEEAPAEEASAGDAPAEE